VLFLGLSQHLANRLINLPYVTYLTSLWRPLLLAGWVGGFSWLGSLWLPDAPLPAAGISAAIVLISGLSGLRLCAWDLCLEMWRSARGES
jgi:hypothetical protein